MDFIISIFDKAVSGVGPFVLLLGLLVFVHELGHFLVAIWCGVRVETFSLGFGKKLFSYKRNHTTYCLSLIPLGGYVKMFGDDPNQTVSEEDKKHSFLHKTVSQRIAIVLAGPLMNLFFAALIFTTVGLIGEEVPGARIGDIANNTAAHAAGFRSGDQITKVNGTDVYHWKEIQNLIEASPQAQMSFSVIRNDSSKAELIATPTLEKNEFIFTTRREIGKIAGLGMDSAATMVGVLAGSPAANAGLKTFDLIEEINGKKVSYWRQLEPEIIATVVSLADVQLKVKAFSEQGPEPESRTVVIPLRALETGTVSLASLGILSSDLFLLGVKKDSPAGRAGMMAGDLVVAVDSKPATQWGDVLARVKGFKKEQGTIHFSVRRNAEPLSFDVAPEEIELPTAQGAMESRFAVGIVPAILTAPNEPYLLKSSGIGSAVIYGMEKSWEWSKFIAISFVRLVQAEVSPKNIGGVITIGRVASQSYEAGLVTFLRVMAIISINLFLLNLLPVPVLDGGHLVFFTIEAIKGSPLSLKKMELAQQVGLVLLLGLMVFALLNDIRQLFSAW